MIDEQAIIERVLAGDNEAFGLLVETYQTRVYNLALRMCGDPDDAFDLAQDAFFRAWQGLSGFQFSSSFSTWLSRLTSNICLDHLRAKKRHNTVSLTSVEEDEAQLDVVDHSKSPEALLLAAEDHQALTAAINALPVEYRQILTMRAINDMSYTEIAEALQLPDGTVKSRLNRARRDLQKNLLQIGNFFESGSSISIERRESL